MNCFRDRNHIITFPCCNKFYHWSSWFPFASFGGSCRVLSVGLCAPLGPGILSWSILSKIKATRQSCQMQFSKGLLSSAGTLQLISILSCEGFRNNKYRGFVRLQSSFDIYIYCLEESRGKRRGWFLTWCFFLRFPISIQQNWSLNVFSCAFWSHLLDWVLWERKKHVGSERTKQYPALPLN